MMSNINYQNQFMNDVNGVASNMMTQMICAEKGIDYNLLIQSAQQAHINALVEQERQKQVHQLVRNHYEGRDQTFFGRLRIAMNGGTNYSLLTNQQQMMPQSNSAPSNIADFLSIQQGQQNGPNSEMDMMQQLLQQMMQQENISEKESK